MKNTQEWSPAQEAEKMQLIGATLAMEFVKSDKSANETKRELLISSARAHASNAEGSKALLEGYANKFKELGFSDSIVRTRKSEANTVFKAYSMTEISKDNQTALEAFDGGYHEFIALARSLVASAKSSDVNKTVSTRKPKVTEHQEQFITDKMKSATIYQLTDFIESGVKELNKPHDVETAKLAERNQLALIVSICRHMTKNDTCEALVKDCANKVIELIKPVLAKLDIVATEATQATNDVMQQEAVM